MNICLSIYLVFVFFPESNLSNLAILLIFSFFRFYFILLSVQACLSMGSAGHHSNTASYSGEACGFGLVNMPVIFLIWYI